MSDADKMLEELGYTEINELLSKNKPEIWGIEYIHYRDNMYITFDLVGKEVCVSDEEGNGVYFSMEELKAINEKVKELDW